MESAAIPPNETFRLEALRSLCILDTPGEERFERITRSVSHLFKTPIALVSLVDSSRQWFKSHHGLEASETSREVSFCAHAILSNDVFVVEDAALDPRFSDNPLVTGPPHIRFYAGVPLRGPKSAMIGTLCLIDRVPRVFSSKDRDTLAEIGSWAEREINQMTLQKALALAIEGEAFFELSMDLACMAGSDGLLYKVNSAFQAVLGHSKEELLNTPFMDLIHHEDQDRAKAALAALSEGREVRSLEIRLIGRDGSLHWLDWTARAIDQQFYVSGRDITEQKAAQARLWESEARYRDLTDLSPDIVARHDLEGRFTFVSPVITRLLGHRPEALIGHLPNEFVVKEDQGLLKRYFMDLLAGKHPDPAQFRAISTEGGHVWLETRGSLERDSEGRLKGTILTSRDITAIKIIETRLVEASNRDVLTGLYNRRFFMGRLDSAFHSSQRHSMPMSLCICDLDRFKWINDTHGHGVGDDVLREVGNLFQKEVRGEDLVARFGGDEFCFLFPFTPAKEAADCLKRILPRLRTLRFKGFDGAPFAVSATFGLADRSPNSSTKEQLLESADQALYQAKAKGRDCIHILE